MRVEHSRKKAAVVPVGPMVKGFLIGIGLIFVSVASADERARIRQTPAVGIEEIRSAQAASNASEIMKIARELADEIGVNRRSTDRVIATAIGLYRKAEAIDPESLDAADAGRLGRLYLRLSESYADVASRYLARATAGNGNLEDHVALGNALLYLGSASEARREYLKVSARRPDDPVLVLNLALAERAMGDTASAFGRLRKMTLTPLPAPVERAALLALADIQLASRDWVGARVQTKKILEKRPGDRDALMLLKQIYEKEGRADLVRELDRQLKPPSSKTPTAGVESARRLRKGDQK